MGIDDIIDEYQKKYPDNERTRKGVEMFTKRMKKGKIKVIDEPPKKKKRTR